MLKRRRVERPPSTPRADAPLPSIGLPGDYKLLDTLLDDLHKVEPEFTSAIAYLERHPEVSRTIRDEVVFGESRNDATRRENGRTVGSRDEYIRRLDDYLLADGGMLRLAERLEFLAALSDKQRRGRERAALLHPCGQQRLDFVLLRTMISVLRSAGVLQRVTSLRSDCLVCHGTFFPGAPEFGDKQHRWWRHYQCGAWVCGDCFDRMRESTSLPQCCPLCRGPLDDARVSKWYGRLFAGFDRGGPPSSRSDDDDDEVEQEVDVIASEETTADASVLVAVSPS